MGVPLKGTFIKDDKNWRTANIFRGKKGGKHLLEEGVGWRFWFHLSQNIRIYNHKTQETVQIDAVKRKAAHRRKKEEGEPEREGGEIEMFGRGPVLRTLKDELIEWG